MLGDPTENTAECSMLDPIESHAATAIVGKGDHAIDVWKGLHGLETKVPCDRLGYTRRAVDRRYDGDVITGTDTTAWPDVSLEGPSR